MLGVEHPRLRRAVWLLSALVILALSPAYAAQTELEDAEQEAAQSSAALSRAEAVRIAAEADYSSAEIALGLAVAEFSDAQQRFQRVNELVLTLQGDIGDTERQLGLLRGSVIESAVEGYMAVSQEGQLQSFLSSTDAMSSLIHFELATAVADQGTRQIADYSAIKAQLDRQKTELEGIQTDLSALTDELASREAEMRSLLGQAAADASAAKAEVIRADTAYRASLTRVEEEQNRLASLVGSGSWRPLVAEFFPAAHVEEALAIMQCESRGNPNAVNPTSGASGLFQFLESTWLWASPLAGYGGASRFDPVANTASAAWLFQYTVANGHRNGIWAHWECRRVLY